MQDPARDFVLRALAASEIADSSTHPGLRRQFQDLAADWLRRAAEVGAIWTDDGPVTERPA
jgi:hypothetical protein